MRVIKDGYIKETQVFCQNCGATIGYYPHDVKSTIVDGYVQEQITCPICSKYITTKKYSIKS